MRILICGPRAAVAGGSLPGIRRSVCEFVAGLGRLGPDVVVVTGGARGVDELAALKAAELGLSVEVVKPDYERHGKAAPLIRDRAMVDMCDGVVAFCRNDWSAELDGGTAYTADYARKRGKLVWVRPAREAHVPWPWLDVVLDRSARAAELPSQASLF